MEKARIELEKATTYFQLLQSYFFMSQCGVNAADLEYLELSAFAFIFAKNIEVGSCV